MGGNREERDGRHYLAEDQGQVITIDKLQWARAGFQIPRENTVLDSERFWQLTGEGWRFVVGQDGCIVACMPPTLGVRLEALTETNILRQKQALTKKKKG